MGRFFKGKEKGMITPVINLVSKTAFILFFFLNRRAYTIEYKDI